MTIWQVDFYRRPLKDAQGQPLWELVICDQGAELQFSAYCPQQDATADWVKEQLQQVMEQSQAPPEKIQVFRPQALQVLEMACESLTILVEPTRRTHVLKQYLKIRSQSYPSTPGYNREPYDPLAIEQPPPQPLPEHLWGETWQFATLSAEALEEGLLQRPIPIRNASTELLPSQLHLAPSARISGVVIYGDRHSMPLARWVQQQQPVSLQAVQGEVSGVVMAAGLCDRWILVTYDDPTVLAAAQTFEHRRQANQGLHFLLVQPDNSNVTFTGLWLLAQPDLHSPSS